MQLQMRTAQEVAFIVMDFVSKNVYNIIGGIIIVAAGWFAAQVLGRVIGFLLLRRRADVTITKFLVDIIKFLVISAAVLLSLGNFGITIAPFIAGLGAVGFGASFAFQGPLSNYASGATLIFTKPFKVGDILEVNGQVGQVEDMTLARTIIRTLDGTRIIIPNKRIVGEIVHNYSEFKLLELTVGVAYGTDIDRAVTAVRSIVEADKRVMARPAPKVGISAFADSSMTLYARLWCRQAEYWDVLFDVNRSICKRFKEESITIPFPQRDIHMVADKGGRV